MPTSQTNSNALLQQTRSLLEAHPVRGVNDLGVPVEARPMQRR